MPRLSLTFEAIFLSYISSFEDVQMLLSDSLIVLAANQAFNELIHGINLWSRKLFHLE